MSSEASRVGTIFSETYHLDRLIGEGGMGSVYAATHRRVPRKFAIKLLNPAAVSNPQLFERFQREAQIASSVGHENIVQVFDFNYSEDGTPYMVLELLEGEDLSERLKRGKLTMAQTRVIIEQVAGALAAAHAGGIVHRDLKPGNIFLCPHGGRDDFVKILDFGISKIVHAEGQQTVTGMLLGTPAYMSPEQAEGRAVDIDARTDVFAIGAILYECLTGERAFTAPTPMGVLYQVCMAEIPPVPGAPEGIDWVIQKACAKKREDRFATMDELRAKLVDVLERGRAAISTVMVAPASAKPKSRAALYSIIGGLLAGGIAVAVFAATRHGASQTTTTPAAIAPVEPAPPPPAAAPTPPPVAPPAPAPVPADVVTLALEIDPVSAETSLDGVVVTGTRIVLPRSTATHELTSADGYVSQTQRVGAAVDGKVKIKLARVAISKGQPPATPRPAATVAAPPAASAAVSTPPKPSKGPMDDKW